jgi:AP-2 complex subunit alpha
MDELIGLDIPNSNGPNLATASHLSPDWEPGYNRLMLQPEGLLYEDVQMQVGLRSEYRAEVGCIILYFSNKSSSPIQSFTTTIDNPSSTGLKVDIKGLPETTVQPGSQTSQMIMFEAKTVFTQPPTIRISYIAGSLQAVTLQLPLLLHKYMEGAVLSGEDFFKRWKQIGGAPRESQKIFQGFDVSGDNTRRLLMGFKWGVLDGVDPNVRNFVGATVLHTTGGKIGCLLRLEPNAGNRVCSAIIDEKVALTNTLSRCTV